MKISNDQFNIYFQKIIQRNKDIKRLNYYEFNFILIDIIICNYIIIKQNKIYFQLLSMKLLYLI